MLIDFHAREERNYWIIDSGFSNNMTCHRIKFVKVENYDSGLVKFGDDTSVNIVEKVQLVLMENIKYLSP
jgi:hypothetical protein